MARVSDMAPSVNLSRAFARWGEIAEITGDYGPARSRYQRALAVGRAIDDPVRIGTARLGLGAVAAAQGDLTQARPLFEDALAAYRKASDRERARWPLEAMGRLPSPRATWHWQRSCWS
jgi:tetratricopeptide (TPR) repeat protein